MSNGYIIIDNTAVNKFQIRTIELENSTITIYVGERKVIACYTNEIEARKQFEEWTSE